MKKKPTKFYGVTPETLRKEWREFKRKYGKKALIERAQKALLRHIFAYDRQEKNENEQGDGNENPARR